MHNSAGGFLHRLVHKSIKSSFALFRRELEQQEEAGSDLLIPLIFLDNTKKPVSALITTNFLDISFLCLSLVGIVISPPHSLAVNPAGDPLPCSHVNFSWISTDFILGCQAEKVCRYSEPLTQTFTVRAGPPLLSSEQV